MKVRNLIELLAKQDWNATVFIDTRKDIAPVNMCNVKQMDTTNSVSSFTSKGNKPVVSINTRK